MSLVSLSPRSVISFFLRFVILVVLYFVVFIFSGSLVAPALPAAVAEPGPLPLMATLVLMSAGVTLVIALLVLSSRWHGLRLMVTLALVYYGAVTFLMQIESWYFLYGLTIGPELMPLLFVQGLPVALVFVPLAVLILGRARAPAAPEQLPAAPPFRWQAWAWQWPLLAAVYVVLYFGAGYFIAWQNPAVRAFYGEPGPALHFLAHTAHIMADDPWLIPFQIVRGLLWVLCALPIVRGTRWPLWATALVVGLLLGLPQNIGHLLPNSLLPINSVRLSHLVETASSTFVFGLIVTWWLYPHPLSFSARAPEARPAPAPLRP